MYFRHVLDWFPAVTARVLGANSYGSLLSRLRRTQKAFLRMRRSAPAFSTVQIVSHNARLPEYGPN